MNHFRLDNLHLGCILTARGTFPNSDQWPAGSQPRGFLRSDSRALLCAASARARPCRYTFGPSCKQARKSPTDQETPTNKTETTVKANTKRQRHTSERQEQMANWQRERKRPQAIGESSKAQGQKSNANATSPKIAAQRKTASAKRKGRIPKASDSPTRDS